VKTDQEFAELWDALEGNSYEMARRLGVTRRGIMERRRRVEANLKRPLKSSHEKAAKYEALSPREHKSRVDLGIESGVVIVFSDAHFWPGIRTAAFRGLLKLIADLKPKAVVCNGDAFDGASISRHPRIGWDSKPSVIEELKACTIRLTEIEDAAGSAKLVWPLGNHDSRFETRLAAVAPEFQGINSFHLKDHFPAWKPCWTCWVNDSTVIKHRYKNGVHATHNNAVNSGKSIVTGHLHSLKVTPFSDYSGVRFGVDTGTLADIHGPQFEDYLEGSPTNWRSGFAVLTFHKGRLLWPELAHAIDDKTLEFRGQVIGV
jgi:hypothetical protein